MGHGILESDVLCHKIGVNSENKLFRKNKHWEKRIYKLVFKKIDKFNIFVYCTP